MGDSGVGIARLLLRGSETTYMRAPTMEVLQVARSSSAIFVNYCWFTRRAILSQISSTSVKDIPGYTGSERI